MPPKHDNDNPSNRMHSNDTKTGSGALPRALILRPAGASEADAAGAVAGAGRTGRERRPRAAVPLPASRIV